MYLCGIIRCKHFPEYYWPKYLFLKLFPDVGHLVVIAFWASKGKLHRVYVMWVYSCQWKEELFPFWWLLMDLEYSLPAPGFICKPKEGSELVCGALLCPCVGPGWCCCSCQPFQEGTKGGGPGSEGGKALKKEKLQLWFRWRAARLLFDSLEFFWELHYAAIHIPNKNRILSQRPHSCEEDFLKIFLLEEPAWGWESFREMISD